MEKSMTREETLQCLMANVSNSGYKDLIQSLALDKHYLAMFLVQVRYLVLSLGSMVSYGNIFQSSNLDKIILASDTIQRELSSLLKLLTDPHVGSITWDERSAAVTKLETDLSLAEILVNLLKQS